MASRSKFQSPAAVVREYERQLRRVARIAAGMVDAHVDEHLIRNQGEMIEQLRKYSESLTPWAGRTAQKMLERVSISNLRGFFESSKELGRELRAMTAGGGIGQTIRALQAEQVTLIKSLPIEAGTRAQSLALSAVTGGRRAEDVAVELAKTEQVTLSRATLIARTESAKAASVITEARSVEVGSKAYIWRTAGDSDVRESHAEMEGEVVMWDSPPTLSDGTTTHAGQIYNCRCFAEPIIPGA